jgi:hypothetical protein
LIVLDEDAGADPGEQAVRVPVPAAANIPKIPADLRRVRRLRSARIVKGLVFRSSLSEPANAGNLILLLP